MAEHNYHQAGSQHLAYLRQTQHQPLTPGAHNPWEAEAGLEAHLQRRQQQALLEVQELEHQRLAPRQPQTVLIQHR